MDMNIDTVREISDEPAITHCSSIIELNNGDLLCVWYEGPYETSIDSAIKCARKKKNKKSWGPAHVLFNFPGMPMGNPVLWTLKEKRIFIVFSVLLVESWKESLLFCSSSIDNGENWDQPTLFLSRRGFMPKTRPILTKRNQLLFPLYHEKEYCPYILVIADIEKPLTSTLVAETMARGKAIQPAIVHLQSKTYLMLLRTNQGTIWKSISYNNGLSWTICKPTLLPNPDSAIDVVNVPGGDIVLAFNNSAKGRHSLSVAISKDRACSWCAVREIVKGDGEYSYPSLMIDMGGAIHVSYTESRYRIRHTVFDKEWILEGGLSEPLLTETVE